MKYIYFILLLNEILLVTGENLAEDVLNFAVPENVKEDNKSNIVASIKSLIFLTCCLFAGVGIHFGSEKYHYPYTVGCFLFGVFIGLIEINSVSIRGFTTLSRMNPHDMLLLFLPVLIFESSFGMDAHMFYKALPQCLILAVLGFLFCTALIAVFAKFVLHSYKWDWLTAFVFGSIVSATDPVAVVALLKEMKMPHTFTVLIEGESLLNDGVAVVLYDSLTRFLIDSGKKFEAKKAVTELLETVVGAPVLGYALAKITEWILIRIYISPVSEMSITIILAYVTYFVAENFLGISAILAVVLYGVTLSANKMCISPESEELIHTNWRLLSIYANTLIFMFVGILVTVTFSAYYRPWDVWLIFIIYLALICLRSVMVAVFYPLLQNTGYGLNWKEGIILSWGGLRGAIGLALSLMFASNPHIPASVNPSKVLIQVAGVIVLTLVVNANSIKYIMKVINFKEITLVNRLSMGNAIETVNEIKKKSLRICQGEWKFMKADWDLVIGITEIKDPYEGGLHGDDPGMRSLFLPYGTCNECVTEHLPYAPSPEELNQLKEAARKKCLKALKGDLWKQFRKGLLQRRSLKLLCVTIDNTIDVPHMYLKTKDIQKKLMHVSRLTHWLETNLSYFMRKTKYRVKDDIHLEIYHLKKSDVGSFRHGCIRIYYSKFFEPIIFTVIVLNLVHVSMDIYLLVRSQYENYKLIMYYFAVFFILFYILEIVIKLCALKLNLYLKLPWNKLDFCTSILSIVEGALDIILITYKSNHSLALHVRIIIFVRLFKYCDLAVNLFVSILSIIRNFASSELYYVYDTGRGFLFATEAVLKHIDVIVDFGPCAKEPISVYKKNLTEMLGVLDEFEKNYPAVAVALKSNRAARMILNRAKVVLDRLKKRSLILQEDATKMKSILFKMTKNVVYAPRARVVIRNIQHILEDVDWMNSELAKDIYENHSIVTYKRGEKIQEIGKMHQFVFIIAKGLIKVDGTKVDPISEYQLPNVDSVVYFQEKTEYFRDYLASPETIGLLGFLQKTPSVTEVECERDCELIQIKHSFLYNAEEKFDDLIYCMWRSISIKISSQLLKNLWNYKMYSSEDIDFRLQRALLPDLRKATSFEVPSVVEDMIIIQGRIKDVSIRVEFIGPSYIPSTSHHLKLLDDVNSRPPVIMLLLLNEKYSYHTCTNWVLTENIYESVSEQKID